MKDTLCLVKKFTLLPDSLSLNPFDGDRTMYDKADSPGLTIFSTLTCFSLNFIDTRVCIVKVYEWKYMCLSLTFWVQLTNFAILRIWYHSKGLCLKITVLNTK